MTRMRSLLFVPGDSEKKLAKSATLPADLLILDLEDAVSPENKSRARGLVADYLGQIDAQRRVRVWVRINAVGSAEAVDDLAAVMPFGPGGIVLPKTGSFEDVETLGRHLDDYEADLEIEAGSTRILPVASETPQSIFSLGSYGQCGSRLAGMTWGAEDLSAAVGAVSCRDGNGDWTTPYQMVRSLCLFGAHAAGVAAIDTLHANFRDTRGLERSCAEARRDGFNGKLAIHPDQVEIINSAFTPSPEEIERAHRVVALFEANPGQGAVALDGAMLDLPHLVQARKILAAAEGGSS